jgi:hypothetical protein
MNWDGTALMVENCQRVIGNCFIGSRSITRNGTEARRTGAGRNWIHGARVVEADRTSQGFAIPVSDATEGLAEGWLGANTHTTYRVTAARTLG